MRKWFGSHSYSSWLIIVSVLLVAMTVHPSLLSYLFILGNAGLMIVTREIARYEGSSRGMSVLGLCAGIVIVVAVGLIIAKINWLAI